MERERVFVFILCVTTVLSASFLEEYASKDDERINELQIQDESTEGILSKYEVTEIVEDIPNSFTNLGPIITNYTIARPLNYATTPISSVTRSTEYLTDKLTTVSSVTESTESVTNKITDNELDNKTRKNYISIFHIKAEYDKDEKNINSFSETPHVSGFKAYIDGLKKGIVDGFNSIIKINRFKNLSEELPGVFSRPIIFFNKLRGKSSDSDSVSYRIPKISEHDDHHHDNVEDDFEE